MEQLLSIDSTCAATTLSISVITAAASIAVYIAYLYIDIPKIQGLPEIPGGTLLEGHLYELGNDHATTAESWSRKYGWPVFQFRMGRRRAVIINSFDAARQWFIKNQAATVVRPWFYTFHGIVSKTSAATIGTSPWNERTKKQRRVVGAFTTGPAMKKMSNMIDMETIAAIACVCRDGRRGEIELEPHIYLKRLALNVVMSLCYGTRFSTVRDPILLRILNDATIIASFRSTNSNPQDFVPHLRYLSRDNQRTEIATQVRPRRDKWLATMLENIKKNMQDVQRPGDKKCVAELLLGDFESEGLTEPEVRTILGGLMSGGFETVLSTAIIAIGVLSKGEAGQSIQRKTYDDIITSYGSAEKAFTSCMFDERSACTAGLVKETLRCYPLLKLLPARQVYKDFEFEGAVIPKGLLFYVNAQAANHDKDTYGPDANSFNPDRWVKTGDSTSPEIPAPYHFAYGAGARMCTAVNFSNRLLYVVFVRTILAFQIKEGKEMPCDTDRITYKADPAASNAISKPFTVRYVPRDRKKLDSMLAEANKGLTEFVTGDNAESLIVE